MNLHMTLVRDRRGRTRVLGANTAVGVLLEMERREKARARLRARRAERRANFARQINAIFARNSVIKGMLIVNRIFS